MPEPVCRPFGPGTPLGGSTKTGSPSQRGLSPLSVSQSVSVSVGAAVDRPFLKLWNFEQTFSFFFFSNSYLLLVTAPAVALLRAAAPSAEPRLSEHP